MSVPPSLLKVEAFSSEPGTPLRSLIWNISAYEYGYRDHDEVYEMIRTGLEVDDSISR